MIDSSAESTLSAVERARNDRGRVTDHESSIEYPGSNLELRMIEKECRVSEFSVASSCISKILLDFWGGILYNT